MSSVLIFCEGHNLWIGKNVLKIYPVITIQPLAHLIPFCAVFDICNL